MKRMLLATLLNGVYLGLVKCQCILTGVKTLLDGCEKLKGLNVTSVGGTVVDDHNCDVVLPKQVFAEEPTFKYLLADSKKFYSILMLDPDAPPQTDGEFYLHMLKSNLPGVALKNTNEGTKNVGIDFRAYKPPTPSRGSGVHRYLCLVFQQGDGSKFLGSVPPSRGRLRLAEWLRGKNLCGPIAGTQFRTHN